MWGRHKRLDRLAADADARARAAEQARAQVEQARHRSFMVASTSERLNQVNSIAAMVRDGLLGGRHGTGGAG